MEEPGDTREPGDILRFISEVKAVYKAEEVCGPTVPVNLLSASSRYGLVFTANGNTVKVFCLNSLYGEEVRALCTFSVNGQVTHLSTNCTGLILFVVVIETNGVQGFFYDVHNLTAKLPSPFFGASLSPSLAHDCHATSVVWSPVDPCCVAVANSKGDITVMDVKDCCVAVSVKMDLKANSLCFSPRGKQLAIGLTDGQLYLVKPDLSPVRTVKAPPTSAPATVIDVTWFSNTEFFVCFSVDDLPMLLYIKAPVDKDPTYVNFDDLCFSSAASRPLCFYSVLFDTWKLYCGLSSHSVDMGVAGCAEDVNLRCKWVQWSPDDYARASMHFIRVTQETYPLGVDVVFSSRKTFTFKEVETGPFPVVLALSSGGEINLFHVDMKMPDSEPSLTYAPRKLPLTGIRTAQQYGYRPPPLLSASAPQGPQSKASMSTTFAQAADSGQMRATVASLPGFTQPLPVSVPPSSSSFSFHTGEASASHVGTGSAPSTVTATAAASPALISQSICSVAENKLPSPKPVADKTSESVQLTLKPSLSETVASALGGSNTPTIKTSASKSPTAAESPMSIPVSAGPGHTTVLSPTKKLMNCITANILGFDQELKDNSSASINNQHNIGNEHDMESLQIQLEELRELMHEIRHVTSDQSREIAELHRSVLEALSIYEHCYAKNETKLSSRQMSAFSHRPLDPHNRRTLEEIRFKYQYLRTQIANAKTKLDLSWDDFSVRKKKQKELQNLSETLYKSVMNIHLYRKQCEAKVDQLCTRLRNLHLKSIGSHYAIPFSSERKHEVDLSELEKSLMETHLEATDKVSLSNSVSPAKMELLQKAFLNRNATPLRTSKASRTLVRTDLDSPGSGSLEKVKASLSLPDTEHTCANRRDVPASNSTDTPLKVLSSLVSSVAPDIKPTDQSSISVNKAEQKENTGTTVQTPPVVVSSISEGQKYGSTVSVSTVPSIRDLDTSFKTSTPKPTVGVGILGGSQNVLSLGHLAQHPHSPIPSPGLTSVPTQVGLRLGKESESKAGETLHSSASLLADSPQLSVVSGGQTAVLRGANLISGEDTGESAHPGVVFGSSLPPVLVSVSEQGKTVSHHQITESVLLPAPKDVDKSISLPSESKGSLTETTFVHPLNLENPSVTEVLVQRQLATTHSLVMADGNTTGSAPPGQHRPIVCGMPMVTQSSGSSSSIPLVTAPKAVAADSAVLVFDQSVTSAPSIFAQTNTSAVTSPSLFRQVIVPVSTAPSQSGQGTTPVSSVPSLFGQSSSSLTSGPSLFGQGSTFTTSAPSLFSQASASSGTLTQFGQGTTFITSAPSSDQSSTNAASIPSIFGQNSTASASTSPFGQGSTSTTIVQSIFGQSSSISTTTAPSIFGQGGLSTSTSSPFAQGNTSSTSSPSLFGQCSTFTTSTPSMFVQTSTSTTTAPSLFTQGTSVFGQSGAQSLVTPNASSPFATTTADSSSFGTSGSLVTMPGGATVSSSSVFGQMPSSPQNVFGQSTPGHPFGFSAGSAFGQKSLFGQANQSPFGTQTSGSGFGQSVGFKAPESSVFGQSSNSVGLSGSVFGNASLSDKGSSIFGGTIAQAAATSPFDSQKTSVFGASSQASSGSLFGNTGASVFGNAPLFSGLGGSPSSENTSKNVFGKSFGAPKADPGLFGNVGSVFGSQAEGSGSQDICGTGSAFTKPQGPTFGGAPMFGGSPSYGKQQAAFGSSPAFGQSPMLGSPGTLAGPAGGGFSSFASGGGLTFGSLANSGGQSGFGSGGGGFGETAQQADNVFGGNTLAEKSFSTWR